MKLIIEIPCISGLEMENNLNKAIDDFGEALKKRGFSEMELIAYNETVETAPIYKVSIIDTNKTKCGKCEMLGYAAPCDECYRKTLAH